MLLLLALLDIEQFSINRREGENHPRPKSYEKLPHRSKDKFGLILKINVSTFDFWVSTLRKV